MSGSIRGIIEDNLIFYLSSIYGSYKVMIHEKNKSYRDGKFWYGLLNRFTVELLNDIKYGRDTISGAKEHAGNECRKVKEELIDKIIADNKNKTVLLNNFPDSVGVEIHIAD